MSSPSRDRGTAMDRFFRIGALTFAAGLLGLAAVSQGMAQGAPQNVPKGDAVNGRKLYLDDGCYQCHGRVGQGGSMNGPAPIQAQTRMPYAAFSSDFLALRSCCRPRTRLPGVFGPGY